MAEEILHRDENRVTPLMGVLYSDGVTLVPIAIDGTNLSVDQTESLAQPYTEGNALRDDNRVTVLMGVSSVDGITPVPVFVTSEGRVLIDS